MTTPTGTITLTDVQTEFGGSNPISISEYYSGAGYVPPGTSGVPSSGTISMDNLRGKSNINYGTVTPSVSSISEGQSVTFTFNAVSVPDGTYYWKLTGTNINASDFSAITGSFTVTSNYGTFQVTSVNGAAYEGTESFRAELGDTAGVPVSYVNSTYVSLTDANPTYSVTPTSTTMNEGATVTFNVATTNVPDGTTLYWNTGVVSGTVNASDFSDGATSGSFTINSNIGSFIRTTTNDVSTEGNEVFNITIRTGSVNGTIQATSANVTISDTSKAPTYSVSPSVNPVSEGVSMTANITTSNVANGTTLYYSLSLSNATSADFSTATTGSFTINNNAGSFTITTVADLLTEAAAESFIIQIRTGSTSGTIVASSASVTITDTSLSQIFNPTQNKTTIYRQGTQTSYRQVTHTLTTTNVPIGTTIYYEIVSSSGTIVFNGSTNSGDLLEASTANSNITASNNIVHYTNASEYTNGSAVASKAYYIRYRTGSPSGTIVANGGIITITPAPTYSIAFSPSSIAEGATSTGNVSTANMPEATTLYFTTSGTGVPSTDLVSGIDSGSFSNTANSSSTPSVTFSFPATAAYDSGIEGSESITYAIRTGSTAGTSVATGALTITQQLGSLGTISAVRTGGNTSGSSVSITLAVSGLSAYPASRTLNVWYSHNGGAYTQALLSTTTLTVSSNGTTVSTTTVYTNSNATSATSSLVFQLRATGHADTNSNTLTGSFFV